MIDGVRKDVTDEIRKSSYPFVDLAVCDRLVGCILDGLFSIDILLIASLPWAFLGKALRRIGGITSTRSSYL